MNKITFVKFIITCIPFSSVTLCILVLSSLNITFATTQSLNTKLDEQLVFNTEQVDELLTYLEDIRTQEPEKVARELIGLDKSFSKMTKEQQYRLHLLQSHSYALSGEMDKSLLLLSQNLNKPFQKNMLYFKARMLYLQANIYSHFNNYIESLKSLHQLLPLLSKVDDIESEVYGYSLAVELFEQIDLNDEALKYAKILFGKYERLQRPRHKCFALYSYVNSQFGKNGSEKNQWAEFESLYQESFNQCKLANEKMMMALSLLGKATILMQREQFEKAKSISTAALELSVSIPYDIISIESYLLLAEIERKELRLVKSQEVARKALDLSLAASAHELTTRIYLLLSKLSEELNQTNIALKYLKLYQYSYSKLLNETQSKIIAFETTKLDYLEKERQIRYLNKDRELYTAKAELTESQRNNERMMFLLICGSLVVLTLFAINMTLQKRKYMRLAQFDALTGIFNRGTGQNLAENRYIKDSMSGIDFSVVLFDLDRFKSVNDNYGHAMGDWVLKKVCEVVNKECRSSDIFTRFGGEEFVLFMPNTSESVAREVAVKCKARILAIDTRYSGHEFTISASFGVATSTEKDLSLDPILQRADIAMYQSKEQGRQCT
ncbi:GGDEF domain-containing protein [Shewanella woodyi]|uniref:GGDEF domain-containing protein n=1 Tax=Shewanella woodyi TaxID=60961 RepID=UPI0007E9FCFA|nr:GGDEF domain-containing protein [Shewanella woodyi]